LCLAGSTVLKTCAWYIDLGLTEVIAKDLFSNPSFCAQRARNAEERSAHIREKTPGTYYQGSEAERMLQELGEDFISMLNSIIEILADWVEPYSTATHSTGVIGIRYMDVDAANMGKSEFVKPLLIIPGPRKPLKLRPYLIRTLLVLMAMGKGTKSIRVTER